MKTVRTPVRLQLDSTECGAACLGIVLEYMGSFVSASELRDRCQVSRAGSNAAAILSAAEHYGLACKGLRVDIAQLHSIPLPAIIHWRMNHFVVLEGVSTSAAWINDPAHGRRKIQLAELADSFTGIALTFRPLPTYRPLGKKIGLVKSLWNQSNFCLRVFVFCILAAALSVFPLVAFAVGSQVFIDKALVAGDAYFVRPLTWVLLAFALGQGMLMWLRLATLNDLRSSLSNRLSETFLKKLFCQNILFFSKRFPAEIASRISLSTAIAHSISHEFLESICGVLAACLLLTALFAINAPLAGVVSVALVIVCVIILASGGKRVGLSQQLAHSEGKLQATAIEAFSSAEALKGAGLERFTWNRWHHFLRQSTQLRVELQHSTIRLSSWTGLILSLTTTSVIGGGGLMVVSGRLTLGGLVAFQLLLPFLLGPITEVVRLVGRLQFVSADLFRYADVTDQGGALPTDLVPRNRSALSNQISSTSHTADPLVNLAATKGSETKLTIDAVPGGVAVEVNDLVFSYAFDKQPCLKGISFSIPAGQWLGVAGASGCGKTTLARVLARLYAPQKGLVRFDGLNCQDIDASLWYSLVGYGDQFTSLLPGTLRQYLQGQQQWDDAAILHALDLVGLKDTISRLRNGLGTWLEEDSLSGGELQRIGLARLLLSNARVLILDEITSSLDAATEAKVLQALLTKHSTVIFVSHRPSVLQRCQQVLYLKDGEVAGIDSHENLMRLDRGYSSLLGAVR